MDSIIIGNNIKKLRENKNMTQSDLAEILGVTDKSVSKWETGKGYPDITLFEPLSKILGVSIPELYSGTNTINTNKSSNVLRSKFYVCPICGNIIISSGETVIHCCGLSLPPLDAEDENEQHAISCETIENDYYFTLPHEMTKQHYVSFMAYFTDNGYQIVKLYPEGNAEARFPISRGKYLYYYCNKHGLFKKKI